MISKSASEIGSTKKARNWGVIMKIQGIGVLGPTGRASSEIAGEIDHWRKNTEEKKKVSFKDEYISKKENGSNMNQVFGVGGRLTAPDGVEGPPTNGIGKGWGKKAGLGGSLCLKKKKNCPTVETNLLAGKESTKKVLDDSGRVLFS